MRESPEIPDWLQEKIDLVIESDNWPDGTYPAMGFAVQGVIGDAGFDIDGQVSLLQLLIEDLAQLCEQSAREQASQQKQMASLRAELARVKAAFVTQAAFDRAEALLRSTPEGALHLATYFYEGEIIVLDDPPDEEDDPECELHNCDDLGCGLCHVALRMPHPYRSRDRKG